MSMRLIITNPKSKIQNPKLCLICVGSELLRGKINTHASIIARHLGAIGLTLSSEQTAGDDLESLTRCIRRALFSYEVVIVTGGLGPTFDDLTREAASEASGRPLVLSSLLLQGIKKKFRRAGHRKMPPANKRQAYLLDGAKAISNSVGTAPGQWIQGRKERGKGKGERDRESLFEVTPITPQPFPVACALSPIPSLLILLPGPPSEMEPMLDRFVIPRLARLFERGAHSEAHLHFVGVPESVIDHKIRPMIQKEAGVDFTILAHPGLVDLDIFVHAKTRQLAAARLDRIVRSVRKSTGPAFYGRDADFPLEKVIMDKFVTSSATLAVAESCTGGTLAGRLTSVPGSSKYFLGGYVTYHNRAKQSLLGVAQATLRTHGAVSKETAIAMARGVRASLGSTWGAAITGIAGPSGGTTGKPVGLVFLAVAGPGYTRSMRVQFRGSRDTVRAKAVLGMLNMLRELDL